MLNAKNISFKIGNQYLIENISVDFNKKEFSVIMGQNGAGKSTLLKILAGSLKATVGEVNILNKRIENYKEIELARMRAVLSQHYEIAFPVNVEDVVMMGRYPHFKSEPTVKDQTIIDKTLDLMGIRNLKKRDYNTLSGGEAQKVHMARVLAQIWQYNDSSDKILFLDEPVSQLDIRYQHFILQVAKKYTSENILVIAILHDLNLAVNYADNIIFMKDGKIISKFNSTNDIDKDIINEVFDIKMEKIQNPHSNKPFFVVKN